MHSKATRASKLRCECSRELVERFTYRFKDKKLVLRPRRNGSGTLSLYPVWNILGFQDAKLFITLLLEYFVWHIYTTGLADYSGRHSDADTVSKSIERLTTSKAVERHVGSRSRDV
jgi:hypothetical protein